MNDTADASGVYRPTASLTDTFAARVVYPPGELVKAFEELLSIFASDDGRIKPHSYWGCTRAQAKKIIADSRAVLDRHKMSSMTPTPPPQADREAVLKRPQGNNADEWGVFLEEYEGSIPYVAVQIAEAIDAAAATRKDIDIGIKSLQMLGYRADGTPAVDREAVREAVKAMKEARDFLSGPALWQTEMTMAIAAALTTAIAKLGEE